MNIKFGTLIVLALLACNAAIADDHDTSSSLGYAIRNPRILSLIVKYNF